MRCGRAASSSARRQREVRSGCNRRRGRRASGAFRPPCLRRREEGHRPAETHLDLLKAGGVAEVVVARLDPDDVHEDEAARLLAEAVSGSGVFVEKPFTGRCNLYSEIAGVLTVDKALIDRLNRIDPALTIATLPEFSVVEPGRMVGTVKIIPFAVPRAKLDAAIAEALTSAALSVSAFRPMKVGLVATILPALKPSVMDKTRRLLEERLALAGATITDEKSRAA